MTVFYFILSLGILVFIHEFGHFIVAKKQGIGVEIFSLGFGPRLFGFKWNWRGETEYRVSALPLGGYVKLFQENPEEASESEPLPPEKARESYSRRPILQRFPVVFAGPFMNLLLAFVLMPLLLFIGRDEPVFLGQPAVVIGVKQDSPAARAGLQPGDEILFLDKKPLQNWKHLVDKVIVSEGKTITLSGRRGAENFSKTLRIEASPQTHVGFIGIEPTYFIGNEPVVDEVLPGSPAARAGLQPGDRILTVNGTKVETWTDMSDKVALEGENPLQVGVLRQGKTLQTSLHPQKDEASGRWVMGVRKDVEKIKDAVALKRYPLKEAIVEGTRENIKLIRLTFVVLKKLLSFQLSYKALGGPIRIAQASAMAAESGLADFLYFLAFLSLQLGIMNLLPIPALDGGHLLFFGIEAVTRRPPSARLRNIVEQTGFFLLLTLMLLVTLNDLVSVVDFGKIFRSLRGLF